jgi:hypothetical protein
VGPVTDPRHADLLDSRDAVDSATPRYLTPEFRDTLRDHRGLPVVISWFPLSWSGFTSNPVNRDFGWFTIYDHMVERWSDEIAHCGDGVYWMYNHPDASGIGNKWGLDWQQNVQYLHILNRMILDRGFFPGAVQIPTAATDSTHFTDQFFPFELSNRNSPFINWENVEADGRKTRDILQWADAPDTWEPYRPHHDNHQQPGAMRHWMFRLLDIKTRIMSFPQSEIEKAFAAANDGADVVIAGYEHDFRDRAEAVRDLFLKPIAQTAKGYPDVQLVNATFADAARAVTGMDGPPPAFTLASRKDYWLISSDTALHGPAPYVAFAENDRYGHISPVRTGRRTWAIQKNLLPSDCRIGIAGFSTGGRQSVSLFRVAGETLETYQPEQSAF